MGKKERGQVGAGRARKEDDKLKQGKEGRGKVQEG